jgi:hypothetical protein
LQAPCKKGSLADNQRSGATGRQVETQQVERMISNERRDYYAGALLIAIGAGAAIIGARYQIGALTRMGPGFVPTALGVMLAFIGALLIFLNWRAIRNGEIVQGLSQHGITAANDTPDWWGWTCIISAVLAFVLLSEYAGLAPAIFFCVFIAARGDRTATWLSSFILAAGMTAFGLALFSGLLKVQIPIIRGW